MKRLLTLLPVLVFCLLFAPAVLADAVNYMDEKGIEQTCANATVVTDSNTEWNADTTGGWYVVNGAVTIGKQEEAERITVTGDVRLILADGASLEAIGGITVAEHDSLTIYAQSAGTGTLTAIGISGDSGIGGDDGTEGDSCSAGTVTICGGTVTATGWDSGAGIGGGSGGDGGTVTIYGGTVTATGWDGGAGIGGGASGDGGTVTIHGGTVQATSGSYSTGGAGIGGGSYQDGGTVTITGGTVTANGAGGGAGIVGYGQDGTLTIDPDKATVKQIVVQAGDNESSATAVEGSPFTAKAVITTNVSGRAWFRSVAELLPTPTAAPTAAPAEDSEEASAATPTPTATPLEMHTLYFNTMGGLPMDDVEFGLGAPVELWPYTPVRVGYLFQGWYKDEALTRPVSTIVLVEDTTIYAKWAADPAATAASSGSGGGSGGGTGGSGGSGGKATATPEPTATPTPTPTVTPTPAPTATPEATAEATPAPETETDSESGGFPVFPVAAGVIIVVAAAGVFFLLKRRR